MREEQPLYDLQPLIAAGYTRPEIAMMAKAYREEHDCSLGVAIAALTKQVGVTRDLDNIDLTIHRMIAAWAIKHHVLMTGDALDELEHDLLRPVFEAQELARAAVEAWRIGDDVYGPMMALDAALALTPARVGEGG